MLKDVEITDSLRIGERELSVDLYLDGELKWFRGHFEEQSILPGVVQLEWAQYYAQKLLDEGFVIGEVPQLKFMRPLLPGEKVRLHLMVDDKTREKPMVRFSYQVYGSEEERLATQGKILLCP
jgi:3-hydroxymyristoyl/3-hydroxydecanoyl-(acyl carrier protein) dehydratase